MVLCFSAAVSGQGRLLYFEAQAVGGYSSEAGRGILYSISPRAAMQKPSVGFDLVQRISGATRDYGVASLQVRVAYCHDPDRKLEGQLYNASVRYKARIADLWAGHDRPALGLASYFDNHALLLPTTAMMGYGFDRDWGVGLDRDFAWGDLSASFTTGSGMPIHFKGNRLAAARISIGVLARRNLNIGLSGAYGDILETAGYELVSPDRRPFAIAVVDWTYLRTRYESRLELVGGRRSDRDAYAIFWRLTVNLLEENRLRAELQPFLYREGNSSGALLAAGLSYQLTADLAVRGMYRYDEESGEDGFIAQAYYYEGIQ